MNASSGDREGLNKPTEPYMEILEKFILRARIHHRSGDAYSDLCEALLEKMEAQNFKQGSYVDM